MNPPTDYVFANTNPVSEQQRLQAMQAEFDPDTFCRLNQLGVGPGWTCLEVGCGAGSVLCWLANRVGPSGRAVGVDLDPQVRADAKVANLSVCRGDIVTTDLGEGVFDLVHARFLFIHVPQRDAALANVLRSLKPGGWLLIEEPDFGVAGPASAGGTDSEVVARIYEAHRLMYQSTGGDPFLGRRLIGWLAHQRLHVEEAEATAALWQGGNSRAKLRQHAVQQLRPRLLATGALRPTDLERFAEMTADPATWAFDYTTVAAWGRKGGPSPASPSP